jgi:hypothetical protein
MEKCELGEASAGLQETWRRIFEHLFTDDTDIETISEPFQWEIHSEYSSLMGAIWPESRGDSKV